MDAAIGWIREHGNSLDRPWSVEINISNPHFPQYVTQELWDLYEGHDDLPDYGPEEASAQHPGDRER